MPADLADSDRPLGLVLGEQRTHCSSEPNQLGNCSR